MRDTIRFAATLTVFALVLSLGPLSAVADVLVLRDGSVVETKGPWRADESTVHYFGLDAKPRSVALELVDLDASRDRSAPGQPVLASRVTLYATSWCGYCRKTRELLKSLNVPYVEKDIENDAAGFAEYAKKVDPAAGYEVLDMAGVLVLGYQEAKIREITRSKALAAPR